MTGPLLFIGLLVLITMSKRGGSIVGHISTQPVIRDEGEDTVIPSNVLIPAGTLRPAVMPIGWNDAPVDAAISPSRGNTDATSPLAQWLSGVGQRIQSTFNVPFGATASSPSRPGAPAAPGGIVQDASAPYQPATPGQWAPQRETPGLATVADPALLDDYDPFVM